MENAKNEIINQKKKKFYNKPYFQEYYLQHRDKLIEQYAIKSECELCGCTVTKCQMNRHYKSKKHLLNIEKIKH